MTNTAYQSNKANELDFATALKQFEQAIAPFLGADNAQSMLEMPLLRYEKGQTHLHFPVDALDKEHICDVLELLVKHFEHLRVMSYEPGYILLQDGGRLATPYQSTLEGILLQVDKYDKQQKSGKCKRMVT